MAWQRVQTYLCSSRITRDKMLAFCTLEVEWELFGSDRHTANAQSMLYHLSIIVIELTLLMKKEICDSRYEIIRFYVKDRFYFRKTEIGCH